MLSLLAAIPVLILEGANDAVTYTTVYLIERSLSLDNLFVFLLLFAYFGVPYEHRPRLLFFGIVAALALRALHPRRHGADRAVPLRDLPARRALLVLAYRIFRGVEENVDPDRNLMVRLVGKVYPVTGEFPRRPLVRAAGSHLRHADLPVPGRDRVRRHRVRDRLDPGRVSRSRATRS